MYIQQDSFDQPITMTGLPPLEQSEDGVRDVVVDSRTQRKQLLKEHGMIEMGNEAPPIIQKTRERRAEEEHVDSYKRPL
jgi:hypothetical protein